MAVGFIRRYLTDPGLAELLAIEGVVIVDREPPAVVAGVGAGTVLVVGEFENGPFAAAAGVGPAVPATELLSATDLLSQFGAFGYTYDGVPANNPSARARRADGALADEFWNGNGAIALVNKRFRRLLVSRVDTSVGSVEFRRLACLVGLPGFTYDLEPGQTVVIDLGAGNVMATFNAAVAQITSGAGTYPSTFVGGESITLAVEGVQTQVFFQAADQTQAQVIARVNAALGYTAWVQTIPGTTRFDGRIRGTSGSVQVVAVSGALVTTATGFAPGAAVAGTGNVGNIDAVTVAEAHTVISTAVAGTAVDRDANGRIRVCNTATPLTGTIQVDALTTAEAFGWPEEVTASAATGVDGVIPAGTRVRNVGGTEWVTMQDVAVRGTTGTNPAGPYSVKVRPALDTGATVAALAGTVTVLPFPAPITPDGFAVTNPLPLAAALTEAQLDAAYVAAIDATLNVTTVAREANIIVSARQSNAVRTRLRQNALDASAQALRGRMAVLSPPLNTLRATARSAVAQPGVGAYRDQRVVYAYPGARTFVPAIALRGVAGGLGFTADGLIDTHFDAWVASLMSQVNPEENPGQETPFLAGVVAIEAGNADVQAMAQDDYRAFRAAGIAALRIDAGVAFVQSGVTSVDPVTHPQLRNIARRRMADFVQDSLALVVNGFSKKPMTKQRRAEILAVADDFLRGLLSPDNPSLQRIESYSIDAKSGNTPTSLALGIFRLIIKVRTLPSLDVIVLDTQIGETVQVQEAA